MPDAGSLAYLDSSALIKLIVPEVESALPREELRRWDRYASSALARPEVVRAVVRVDPAAREPAGRVVRALNMIAVTDEILDRAARLPPPALRSLDALHLASALALGETLVAFVTYDRRLGEAAQVAGLAVVEPG